MLAGVFTWPCRRGAKVRRSPTPYGLTIAGTCNDCIAQRLSLFSGLAPPILEKLIAMRQVAVYPPHSVLFVEGGEAERD
jgi:hypothetical protein